MNKDAKPENEAQNKNGESITDEMSETDKSTKEIVNLPEIGKRFYIDGQLFKVTYVNLGRKRFSAETAKS